MNKFKNELRYLRDYFRNRTTYAHCHGRSVPLFQACARYLPWRFSLRQGRSPLVDRVPWIVFGAKEQILRFIRPGSKVFEYGMGGSTLFFLDAGCSVISVEHDPEWAGTLFASIGNNDRWTGLLVPPQPKTAATHNCFSSAFHGHENSDFREYVETITKQPDESLDVVMVDGRARSAALVIAATKVIPGGLLVLDNAERSRYAETVNAFAAQGWRMTRLFGPGPYVDHEFWDTLLMIKPGAASSDHGIAGAGQRMFG